MSEIIAWCERNGWVRTILGATAIGASTYAVVQLFRAPKMISKSELNIIVPNLLFPEGPRWRPSEGKLYFSDFFQHCVFSVRVKTSASNTTLADGKVETVVSTNDSPWNGDHPSGLGWLPDGRLLVSLMKSRCVVSLTPNSHGGGYTLQPWANLSDNEPYKINDMCVDSFGRAYVGGFGFDIEKSSNALVDNKPTVISMCSSNHSIPSSPSLYPSLGTSNQSTSSPTNVEIAANNVMFPNGSIITPDGKTLIVAESFAMRLTAWDICQSTGKLSNRRVWAELPGIIPDGICLDAEGCIWVAFPMAKPVNAIRNSLATIWAYLRSGNMVGGFIRVAPGGEIKQHILLRNHGGFACILGGPTGKTLFLLCSSTSDSKKIAKLGTQNAFIASVEVKVGAAKSIENPQYCAGYC